MLTIKNWSGDHSYKPDRLPFLVLWSPQSLHFGWWSHPENVGHLHVSPISMGNLNNPIEINLSFPSYEEKPKMEVALNRSFQWGISIINHPAIGVPDDYGSIN